ncbi:MAG: GlsB/YeaQ/YmgE family stress response membrane protein [Polaromonas sp.]
MSIIWTILIGFVVGIVAKFLMPGRDPAGFIITAIIGIVGSVIATYLGQALGLYRPGESAGFIAAVIGSIILLFLYRMVTGRKG